MTRAIALLAFAYRLRRARKLIAVGHVPEANRVLRALKRPRI